MKLFWRMQDAGGVADVGGKASALMRLSAWGFNVPPFVVVTPDVVADAGEDLNNVLVAELPRLGPGPYAARSSAREEDGASHSHAGQFLSLLDLEAVGVPEAIRRVYESGLEQSVADYRQSRGLDARGSAPSVVVQQMVRARCAGVAFSADPVSGRRDRIMISAVAGLGDKLVGGEEDGQSYILGKSTGDLVDGPDEPVLSDEDIAALYKLVSAVETVFGGPQDIEWAFEGDVLFLLQARPITSKLRPEAIADKVLTVLDNSNIIESYPGLVSPLTFSFAQYAYSRVYRAFVVVLGIDAKTVRENSAVFDNLLCRVDGRVYYNLGNWYRALSLLPDFGGNRSSMELMMGVDEPLPDELLAGMTPADRRGRVWKAVVAGARLAIEALRLGQTKRGFYERVEGVLGRPASELEAMTLTQLAAEYRRIEGDLLDRWDAPLINDFLCMIAFGTSRKLMEKWAGPQGLALHSDVMIGQGDIISAEPAQRIRSMGRLIAGDTDMIAALSAGDGSRIGQNAELDAAVTAYLDRFADRCAEELKLESVTLDLDPAPLYRAIAASSAQTARVVARADSKAALKRLFAGRPLRRLVATLALGAAKRRVRDRENLRFERTRIFGRGRRLFRAIGVQFHALGLLDDPDDVYLLTTSEVLGAIEGFATSHDLLAITKLRKGEAEASSSRSDPSARLLVRGAVSAGSSAMTAREKPAIDTALERSGTGCSAGKVSAVARVVRDPRGETIERGQILVARHTDPGWIALFTNASAIVVERGSPLSHSAIVARELGIPCVVALKGAMDWITDGEVIEVDGATGLVRRMS